MKPNLAQNPTTPDFEEEVVVEEETTERLDAPWKVLLFNDSVHSFDDVILQIMKAIGCPQIEAEGIAFEAHVKGKALVYAGAFSKRFQIVGILREIQLVVEIEG